jgi:hypothetical protein
MNAPDRLANLRVNSHWAKLPLFDRKGWRRMRFGDFGDSINERVEPADAADEPYIGLDDLDSGDLHIRRWGKGSDVIGTKLRFRKGDIIFGRRRAYQRKLAVAEFDGICSAHAMVVRAKPDIVLPEFLPFLMMSDRFMKRAVEISVGSLSPTINWTTLKLEEFDLPPLEQQGSMANIFSAADEVVQAVKKARMELDFLAHSFRNGIARMSSQRSALDGVATLVTKGESPAWQGFEYQSAGAVFVTSENVLFDRYEREPRKFIPTEFHKKLKRSAIRADDILFNIVGASIGRACLFPELDIEANVNQAVAVIRPDRSKVEPRFLLSYLLSDVGLSSIVGNAVNTARANVSLSTLRNLQIPIPPIEAQRMICDRLASVDKAQQSLERFRMKCEVVQRDIACKVFGY